MGEAPHHYLIFETAGGFCGIAWNNVGITRFQLPTKSAVAAERTLLRRVPGAERGAPTPEVVEAVAAVKRYFEGEEIDFSGFRLDLGAAPGGAAVKIRMLALEGVDLEPPRPAQQSFGF
jgi:methylated-DNA-[protein]-cysteine S-methyltransferase